MKNNDELQRLCRFYLAKTKGVAKKFGLHDVVEKLIADNKSKQCCANEKEVEMLARLCDDERVSRTDIPKMLGKSYRQSNEQGDFDKIRKLRRVGIYSKVSAMLYVGQEKLKAILRKNKKQQKTK